ncbi:MAG: CvpA family protein [Clostridiales bacterium]|nr:CvpA family protein [Clostridiales bacterium]
MADIVIAAIVLVMAVWGWKSGFVRTVFRLGYYIIAVIAAAALYPALSGLLRESPLSAYIHDKVILPRVSVDTGGFNMPSFLQDAVTGGIDGTTEALARFFTDMVLSILCFIAVFIAVRVGLKLAARLLDGIAKLPVLNLFNKVAGLVAGVMNGLILVCLLLGLATVFMTDEAYEVIRSSPGTFYLYNNNILLRGLDFSIVGHNDGAPPGGGSQTE